MAEEVYELISLSIDLPYELDVEDAISKACEEEPIQIEESAKLIVFREIAKQ